MTLEKLIIQCKRQNAKAQGELYKRYATVLFSICLRYSPNYAEAEDNLQDAFLIIFDKIGQYKEKGSFEGWLKRVTVTTVLQKYRKQKVFNLQREEDIEESIIEVEDNSVPLDFLLKIVQELPDRYRLVFTLYVLDDYSHREIAEMMKITDGTSKSNLARARSILKTKVESYQQRRQAL